MRLALACALILATAPVAAMGDAPPPPAAAAAKPTVITQPDWRELPTADQLSAQYPAVAQFVGLSGHVTVVCEVTVAGSTENCHVTEETPPGLGFGEAALALAKDFKLRPMLRDGEPVGGAQIEVPLMFQPPESDNDEGSPEVEAAVNALAPGAQAPPPSAKSLELARKVAALTFNPGQMKAWLDANRKSLAQSFGGAKLTPTQKAALDDYVGALEVTYAARVDAATSSYARRFSEKELTDIGAFFASSSGQAWLARSNLDADKISADLDGDVQSETRRRFCAQFACPPAPGAAPSAGAASPR